MRGVRGGHGGGGVNIMLTCVDNISWGVVYFYHDPLWTWGGGDKINHNKSICRGVHFFLSGLRSILRGVHLGLGLQGVG